MGAFALSGGRGSGAGALAAGLDDVVGHTIEPADGSDGAGAEKFLLLGHGLSVLIEDTGKDVGAENPVGHRQDEEAGDGLVAVDHGVVAQVEAVDFAPEAAPGRAVNERAPLLEGPVLDGVEELIDQQEEASPA